MHELFTTTTVSDADVSKARSVLQAYCAYAEVHQINRVIFYRGPDQPIGFQRIRELQKSPNGRLWHELHQYLSKQSYIVQARYPIEEGEFGQAFQQPNIDQRRGVLKWGDIPDPLPTHASHVQRRAVEIHNQEQLPTILYHSNHSFKSECIEESYTWWRDCTEYRLSRPYRFPGETFASNPTSSASPRLSLPPFSELQPLSSSWLLQMRVVVRETSPENMAMGVTKLATARRDLRGIFEFKPLDRRANDTRVSAPPRSNIPIPLPQVVTVDQA